MREIIIHPIFTLRLLSLRANIINSLKSYSGHIPTKHRKKVIHWAEQNQLFIMKQWNKLN